MGEENLEGRKAGAEMGKKSEILEAAFWILALVCPVANIAALAMIRRTDGLPPEIMPFAAVFGAAVLVANLLVPRKLPNETKQITLVLSAVASVLVTITNLLCAFTVLLPME